MQVWYVFSRFPAATETFAGTDLRMLRELGAKVEAVNLRPNAPGDAALLRQWNLADLPVDAVTVNKLVVGLGVMVKSPRLLLWLVGIVLRDNWRRPAHVFKSVLALPRLFQLHQKLANSPPQVLHLFWGHYPSLLGLLVKRTHPGVVVTLFLGAYDLRARYATSVTLARHADAVFTHAQANVPLLVEAGVPAERIQVIWRGVDLRRFPPLAEPSSSPTIVSVGRLVPEKGMAEVIETFARVKGECPDARLCIIGDGPQRQELESKVCNAALTGVEFTGRRPHHDVLKRLNRAAVFLFLSRVECLPNVVKEAMAAGCPCVVSRTWGVEELVKQGETGFVVEPSDVTTAARHVITLLRDRVVRERIARAARAHIEHNFDARRSMAQYLAVWGHAVGSRRPTAATARPAAAVAPFEAATSPGADG